jgi:hypothetical protein
MPTGDPQDIHDRGDGTLIYPLDAWQQREEELQEHGHEITEEMIERDRRAFRQAALEL